MDIRGIDVFTGQVVEIEIIDGRIRRIVTSGDDIGSERETLPYVSPGFFDIQVNGYRGSDYSLDDFSADHVERIISTLAHSGTTQHIPTIVTSPKGRILKNLETISKARKGSRRIYDAIPGVHVEGPFLSPEDGPRGAHNKKHVREPNFSEFEEWQAAAGGGIVYITVAPERRGAIAFIEKVAATGVVVSLGHHNAQEEDIRRAVDAGARMSTHLGNASHTSLPRLKNYLWQQLANDELTASIISDGFHLPASVAKVIARAKGLERLILVSDVAQFGGYEPGVYQWEEREVEVFDDGHLGLPGTTILAGAAHLLDWDIPRFVEFTGHGLKEAVRLCTRNPAAILKMPPGYGDLKEGVSANLCLFRYTPGDERLSIEKTICAGEVVFNKHG